MKRILSLLLILALLTMPVCAAAGARDMLDSKEQLIYDYLKENILLVANGELLSTRFEAGSAVLRQWEQNGMQITFPADSDTSTAALTQQFLAQFSISDIVEALLHDLPYDLYWYDKTAGAGCFVSVSRTTDGDTATVSRLRITMPLVAAYQNGSSTVLNAEKTAVPRQAAANARAIVDKYAHLPDHEKLAAYSREICALADYDPNILEGSYTEGFGDPWQLINIFDGDPATNVVCEAYAKAFQYLCDLSQFDHARCYSVHGTLTDMIGPGSHMWNLVTMEDGQTYLVDVTNSEPETIGAGGTLFLTGGDGTPEAGFTMKPYKHYTMHYAYDPDSIALWGTDKGSILNVAAAPYVYDADYVPKIALKEPVLTQNGVLAELDSNYRQVARLITAFYKDGRLLTMTADTIATTETSHTIPTPDADWNTCRVFLLDETTHAPLCESSTFTK